MDTVENEEDKKAILDKKLEDCLETVKTSKGLAMKNSSDNDLKEIFRQLKNNDTVGLFRDEYYQLSGNLDTTSELKAEIESIDDIKSMDRAEMDSYIVDKSLDVIDNAGNSLWSLGLTGSLFGVLPLIPISAIGGGLVMTSKGIKVINNGLRLAYSTLVKNNDLKKAEQLGKEINDLKKITVKAGKTLEEFVNNNIKELEKELAKAEGDETKTKEALETFFKDYFKSKVGEFSIKEILTEINKKTGELKDKCEKAIKHKQLPLKPIERRYLML